MKLGASEVVIVQAVVCQDDYRMFVSIQLTENDFLYIECLGSGDAGKERLQKKMERLQEALRDCTITVHDVRRHA